MNLRRETHRLPPRFEPRMNTDKHGLGMDTNCTQYHDLMARAKQVKTLLRRCFISVYPVCIRG
jgi:hypothetical protein